MLISMVLFFPIKCLRTWRLCYIIVCDNLTLKVSLLITSVLFVTAVDGRFYELSYLDDTRRYPFTKRERTAEKVHIKTIREARGLPPVEKFVSATEIELPEEESECELPRAKESLHDIVGNRISEVSATLLITSPSPSDDSAISPTNTGWLQDSIKESAPRAAASWLQCCSCSSCI